MHRAPGQAAHAGTTTHARAGSGLGPRVTAVIVAVALAACTSGAGGSEPRTPQAEEPDAPTTSTTPTTVPPSTALDNSLGRPQELSFAEYQQVLVEADQAVVATLRTLAGAGSYGALQGQVTQSAQTISDAADRLQLITPPDGLSSQHQALATGVAALASDVSALAGRVDGQELCAAPAVVAELERLPGIGQIRAATHAFAAAGGGRVTFVPNLSGPHARRPGNGEHLRPKETSGLGEMEIDSVGVGRDSVVSLARGNSAVLSVYLHGNSTATVAGIGDATYDIYYSHGRDWVPELRAFARDCTFGRFDDSIDFQTTGTEYTIWTISLMESIGGNAPTSPVGPEDFPT